MVAPGLAGLDTVMTLHDAAAHRPSERHVGHHRGQPDSRRRARDRARWSPSHFAIDVTLNREQQITAAFAGNLLEQHRAACAHVKDTAMRAVPAPFDVVLTTNSGYPLDQNLYQAVKGMSAAAKIVKTGRHDRLRRRVPRRAAVARLVRRGAGLAADRRQRCWT